MLNNPKNNKRITNSRVLLFTLLPVTVLVLTQISYWDSMGSSAETWTIGGGGSQPSPSSSVLAYFPPCNETVAVPTAQERITADPSSEQQQQKEQIHMVVVADQAFARRYQPLFDQTQAYAHRHGYTWTVLGKAYFDNHGATHTECMFYSNFFFLKHCWVAAWMEWQGLPSTDAVFVFDADVIPYRFHVGLEKWAGPFRETVVFYVRAWSNEIMAGSYMVRNTVAGRDYLRGWAKYEFLQPSGFSSSDNGALHIHLLRYLGYEAMKPAEKCGTLYANLRKSVTELSDYWAYVTCTREWLSTNETFHKGEFSMRLLSQKKGFTVDAHMDGLDRSNAHAPAFHHGVKVHRDLSIRDEYVERYNLSLPEGYYLEKQSVSCGNNKRAQTCGACGRFGSTCKGDCHLCPQGASRCVHKDVTCRLDSNDIIRDNNGNDKNRVVSCGNHAAASCGECAPNASGCNGDCNWCERGAVGSVLPLPPLKARHQCVNQSLTCRL